MSKDQSIFVIFLAALQALGVLVNSTSQKFNGCKMIEKLCKTLQGNNGNGCKRNRACKPTCSHFALSLQPKLLKLLDYSKSLI